MIAHRGNSSVAPENTLAAVRSALAVDPAPAFVEIDVHATSDGELVVIHDKTLDRTTDASGAVAALELAVVRAADAGHADTFGAAFAGERVPLLSEVLDAVAATETGIMIEIKAAGIGAEVAALVVERGELKKHVIASFQADVLAEARAESAGARLLYLVDEANEASWTTAELHGVEILGVDKNAADGDYFERAHAAGYDVWVWTVNDLPQATALAALGADGIITDYPADVPGAVGGG